MYTPEMIERLQGMFAYLDWVLACCILTDKLATSGSEYPLDKVFMWQENFHKAVYFKVIGE